MSEAPTLHFIYVRGSSIATPFAISNELLPRLSKHYPVRFYDWLESEAINPSPGDILVGHPHPSRKTIFAKSYQLPGWSKRIVLCPYSHGIVAETAYLHPYVEECDAFLAITGNYWMESLSQSLFGHWAPKMVQVDLAVNRANYPFLKERINPAGNRRFVYIGNTLENKNTDYLAELCLANRELDISWIGPGAIECEALTALGQRDFSTAESRELISSFDFLIHPAFSDANATTVLEAASWGLIPVCTPESGYRNRDWIVNIPLDNVARCSVILQSLNRAPEEELRELQRLSATAISSHYNWDRFAGQVLDAIADRVPGGIIVSGENTARNRRILAKLADRGARSHARHQLWHDLKAFLAQLRRSLWKSLE